MNVEEAADALGLTTTSSIYDRLADGRLTGRKRPDPNNPRTKRWDIDPESVEQERLRRDRGEPAPTPDPSRPLYLKLPDNLCDAIGSLDPDAIAAYIRKLRREAAEGQSVG